MAYMHETVEESAGGQNNRFGAKNALVAALHGEVTSLGPKVDHLALKNLQIGLASKKILDGRPI
jgi:hypothetical protein